MGSLPTALTLKGRLSAGSTLESRQALGSEHVREETQFRREKLTHCQSCSWLGDLAIIRRFKGEVSDENSVEYFFEMYERRIREGETVAY